MRKHEAGLRSVTKDKTILNLLEDIHARIAVYENAFQDIKGLYDSTTFGPVHDPALSKITDEATLMAEPTVTPSSVDTTRSLVESARNLEYYVQVFPKSSAGLIATLNLRRWEKNLQKAYDKSGNDTDSKVIFYRRKTSHEISKLRDWLEAEDGKGKNASLIGPLKPALGQYESNFRQLVANQDASYMKKKAMISSARAIENNTRMLNGFLAQDKNDISTMISQMEITLLQCRRAEKNFLMRHDRPSADNFAKGILALRKHEAGMRHVTEDKAILGLLDDINAELANYENSFQDIKGLYDSATFDPVHDRALSKISDEVTLTAEPKVTPSSVDTTGSVIEAARNLEYYVNIFPENSTPLISILQARRWEKNFQKRYDRLTGAADSKSISYIRKTEQEISKIREWLRSAKMKGRTGAEPAPLKSALDRYEFNLAQLARNVDAFYIKKKETVGSARRLERSVQMIKGKVFKTRTETDIDGLYYLRPKSPVHGQPEGNYHDVGALVRNRPSRYGYRHCKNWVQFYFDQEGRYNKEKLVSSVYFHIWIRTVNNSIDVGYEQGGKYSGGPGGMDALTSISYDASKGYSAKNGCSLITGKIDMNCFLKGEEIYRFAIKLSRHSGYPSIVIEPTQYSFIIINPACDSILKSTDSDGDGLNDYEEMFVHYSNPHDEDTDGDGFSDRTEALKGTSANINDLYSGRVIDVITDTPHIDHHKDIDGDWIVDKKERYVNTKFTLHGNLTIRGGGCLALDNCILDMNGKAKNKHIHVDKGSTLTLEKTKVDLNETGYWYRIVEGGKVEVNSDFDIYGRLDLRQSVLRNSFGIKVHQGSKVHICDSGILNCYHLSHEGESAAKIERSLISTFIGIPLYCKSSSPIITDTILSVEYGGVGVYCFGSSPSIDNSKIFVCEDEDSDSTAFILVENSHPVLSSTLFNNKRVRRDNTSSIVFQ
ncbi:MAG: hypothetical protein HWN68_05395 [Desulfobacterales bacterium]|nr:hypothetical protein [Desulfobacterales bacterium]